MTILTKVSTLKDICEAVPIPAVAIGGLNAGNMDVLEGAGMSGMAVVSAIEGGGSEEECAGAEGEDCCFDGKVI